MNNPPESAGERIQFDCSQCSQTIGVPVASAGKRAKCPHCETIVAIPSVGEAPKQAPAPLQPVAPTPIEPQRAPAVATGVETETSQLYDAIRREVAKVFVGQDELVEGTLIAIFSGGHVLIESVPGLGKTLFVRAMGKILGCDFGRIQFTADLMPSDITGAPVFSMKTSEFEFRPGPVFTQLLLADEINRSPAKTHAALLEIMQEKRVTVDGKTHQLDLPFLVLATQNPLESEGTYSLPEAQLDRFMSKLIADYPTEQQEADILAMHGGQTNVDLTLENEIQTLTNPCLLYTSPSPRDGLLSRMPSSA